MDALGHSGCRLGGVWLRASWTGALPAHLVWVTVTAVVIMTDLEHRLIPNRILYRGGATTAMLLLIGALAVLGKGALGMGDVKLSALLGLVCGYWGVEVALRATLSGFLIGGTVALALMVTRRAHRHTQIPFAPALVAGAWWSSFMVSL